MNLSEPNIKYSKEAMDKLRDKNDSAINKLSVGEKELLLKGFTDTPTVDDKFGSTINTINELTHDSEEDNDVIDVINVGEILDELHIITEDDEKSFFDDFVDVGLKIGFHEKYLQLIAFGLLSGACKDKIYISTNYGDLNANIFGLIVGASTIHMKSPTFNYGEKIISIHDKMVDTKDKILLPSKGTYEGLIKYMSKVSSTGLIYLDEFGGWLSSTKKQFNSGMKYDFIELYECRPINKVLSDERNNIEIPNPVVSCIAGVQPGIFSTSITKDDYDSGFIQRFLIANCEDPLPYKLLGDGDDIKDDINRLQRKYLKIVNHFSELFGITQFKFPFEDVLLIEKLNKELHDLAIENQDHAAIYGKLKAYSYKLFLLYNLENIINKKPNNTFNFIDDFIQSRLKDALDIRSVINPGILNGLLKTVLADIEKYGRIVNSDTLIYSTKKSNNHEKITHLKIPEKMVIIKWIKHTNLYNRIFSKHGIHKDKFRQIMDDLVEMKQIYKIEKVGKTKSTIMYGLNQNRQKL